MGSQTQTGLAEEFTTYCRAGRQFSECAGRRREAAGDTGPERAVRHWDRPSSVTVINQRREHLRIWSCKLEASLNQNHPNDHAVTSLNPASTCHFQLDQTGFRSERGVEQLPWGGFLNKIGKRGGKGGGDGGGGENLPAQAPFQGP